jgi:hypothetical protein
LASEKREDIDDRSKQKTAVRLPVCSVGFAMGSLFLLLLPPLLFSQAAPRVIDEKRPRMEVAVVELGPAGFLPNKITLSSGQVLPDCQESDQAAGSDFEDCLSLRFGHTNPFRTA